MRLLPVLALLALLPGCLGAQPVRARFENLGSEAVEVRLVATDNTAAVFDERFTVGGGQVVERLVGTGTLTLRATYTAGPEQDSTSLTVGSGECPNEATVATFTFRNSPGGGPGAFENEGVKVRCEP